MNGAASILPPSSPPPPDIPTPQALVLTVHLPGVTSAAAIETSTTANGQRATLTLSVPSRFLLEVPLPLAVDEGGTTARFDRRSQKLVLTFPVVAVGAGGAGATAAAAVDGGNPVEGGLTSPERSDDGSVDRHGSEGQGDRSADDEGDEGSTGAATGGPPQETADVASLTQQAAAAGGAAAAAAAEQAAADATAVKSANQLRWEALHGSAVAAVAPEEPQCGGSSLENDEPAAAAGAGLVAAGGGLSSPVGLLRPRVMGGLIDELD